MTAAGRCTRLALLAVAVLVFPASLAQAGYTGWGWCPVCGRDMPQSHFPHITGGGGGPPGEINLENNIWHRQRMAVERYENGMAAFKRGDYVQAEQFFRQALDYAFPFDSNPHRMIGQCLEKRGLDAQALQAYQTACRRNALDLAARRLANSVQARVQARVENQAGESLADQGQWRDALNKFQRAASLDSKNAVVADNVGMARRHVRYEAGAAAVQRILSGLVVDVQAPSPSPTVAFQVPAERAYDRGDPSTPVPVGGRVEQAVLSAPPAAPAEPAGKAPSHLHRHLESVVRLANPLNAAQNARDRELLRPLDTQRLMALPPDAVAAHLADRFDAAARQIPLASADRFEEQIRKLQAAGTIPPGDDLLGAMRRDARARAEVNRALEQVAESEKLQVAQAARESVENMVHYLSSRDQYVRDHAAQLLQTIQEMKAQELARAREQAQAELDAAYRQAEQMLRTNPDDVGRMTAVYSGIRARLAQKTVEVHLRHIRYAADIAQRMKEGGRP